MARNQFRIELNLFPVISTLSVFDLSICTQLQMIFPIKLIIIMLVVKGYVNL
jgi:hypothetical protein